MSRRFTSLALAILAMGLGLGLLGSVRAQTPEIKWYTDYNTAIKEAESKGLPLLLDFYTDWCPPCKKMEATTFREEKVVALVNERFVALKINGDQEPKLVSALSINNYPTYVLATPDKKIIKTFTGFSEAPEFHETLQRALAGVATPDWMAKDYQLAGKWIANKEYARAVAALTRIVADGRDRPVQASAQKLLQELEAMGRERLNRAKTLQEQGQGTQAIEILTETMRDFPGLMLSKDAGDMLTRLAASPEIQNQQRAKLAQELLKQAKDFHRNKEYTLCVERCSKLMKSYGDLTEGQEASQLYSDLKNDPEWLQSACDSFADRLGDLYLLLAESWLKRGQPQQAKHFLERVIRAFPGTRQAESAQIRLEQLQGTPTRRVDFQSP